MHVQVGQSSAAGAAGVGGHATWAGAHDSGNQLQQQALLQPALSLGAQGASIEAVQTGGEDVDADMHDAGEVQAPSTSRPATGAAWGHHAQGAASVHSARGPRQTAGPAAAQQVPGLAAAALLPLQGRGSSTLHHRSLSPPNQHSAQSQGQTQMQPGRGAGARGTPAGSSGRPSTEVCAGDISQHHARAPLLKVTCRWALCPSLNGTA